MLQSDIIESIASLLEFKDLLVFSIVNKGFFRASQRAAKKRCKEKLPFLFSIYEKEFQETDTSKSFLKLLCFFRNFHEYNDQELDNISTRGIFLGTKFSGSYFPPFLEEPKMRVSYFEVKIVSHSGLSVGIGICRVKSPSAYERGITFPGWHDSYAHYNIGYHADDGTMRVSQGNAFRSSSEYSYGVGDTVGCLIDYDRKLIFFTKNGKSPGKLSDLPENEVNKVCDTIIGIASSKAKFKVNYGTEPFVFDLKSYLNGNYVLPERDPSSVMVGTIPELKEELAAQLSDADLSDAESEEEHLSDQEQSSDDSK